MTNPFPQDTLIRNENGPRDEFLKATAEQFRQAIGIYTFMALGARNLMVVPGVHNCGGLMFDATVLPMRKNGSRSETPRRMAVMVSLTARDEIDIDVRVYSTQAEHTRIEGVYIDQVQSALIALDYDGPEILNPRYWHSA